MKFNKVIPLFALLLVSINSFAASPDIMDELTFTGKKWKSFTPCQKLFVLGYAAYMAGHYKEAEHDLKVCDGNYPVLQGYITEYLAKSHEGGERWTYIDRAKEAMGEVEVIKKEPPSPQRDYDLARAYFKARKYADAAEWFEAASENGKQRLSALEYLATSFARQEKYDEAIKIQEQIIDEYPKDKSARAKALYKIAFLQMDRGDYKEAMADFKRLKKQAPSYQRQQIDWFLAWCAFKSHEYNDAIKRFAALEKGGKEMKARAKYWRAKALLELGSEEGARGIFRDIYDTNGLSYYGILSGRYLGEEVSVAGKSDDADENDLKLDLEPIEGVAEGDSLEVAAELDKIGITDLVAEELETVIASSIKGVDLELAYELAKRNDAWHVVNYLARKYKDTFPREGAYPRAYQRAVQNYSKRHGVEPFFIWAIMREESTFRPAVVSKSGAVGLMQLMPFTAERMMGFAFPVKNLTMPKFNIDAGVRYLSFLLKHYDGNMFLSAAAYNAGEEAVDRWIGKSSPPLTKGGKGGFNINSEEFAEEVPYKETHAYVKKVMRAYWIYQAIYK